MGLFTLHMVPRCGTPPEPALPLCFCCTGTAADASGSFALGKMDWGGTPPAQPCKGDLLHEMKGTYVPLAASRRVWCSSAWARLSALPQAIVGFFLVPRLYCSLITGPLCCISVKQRTKTFTFLRFP